MSLTEFVLINKLKQADAIILRKKLLGMVDHYAIFLGFRNNVPIFVANYRNGVREVSIQEMNEVLSTYEPTSIEPFPGTEPERKIAVRRALSRIGENAYSYIVNNCEHFKNWVHHGESKSEQVKTAGDVSIALAVGVGIGAVASKSPTAAGIAVGLLLVGLLLHDASED